jgi:hypothetical protein
MLIKRQINVLLDALILLKFTRHMEITVQETVSYNALQYHLHMLTI